VTSTRTVVRSALPDISTFQRSITPSAENAGLNKLQSKAAEFTTGDATWRTGQNIDSRPFALLCANVTSSTKPEVHNVSQCR